MNDIENNNLVNFAPEGDTKDNSVARKKPGPKPKPKPEPEFENTGDPASKPKPDPTVEPMDKAVLQMNDLANRIWEGQSPSLPLNERMRRIKNSLKEKGFTAIDQLILPGKEYKRFL